ncbi:Type II secretion system F domain protein [Coriobacterium glomerans PW2]|uniref:Type II secretion system F domain protein n=1 Tax=Coriobacterium glomerans (strain ATCC 49209 / DSM 20642 / JCM 10262 / PW2) TaxID=700015 RepID=F2NA66_CORGP|nr:type II secretion system F family protein [Coriobacterium glomerans]AEB06460.1 Type II secretion system F domain protein [Coriobacterium glomerans PW2]
MGPISADCAWAAAIGVAWALGSWLVAGWTEADLARVRAQLRALIKALSHALEVVATSARAVARRRFGTVTSPSVRARPGEVSEMIDIVRLGLSAGLSFDAALELFCANRATSLARRMAQASLAWRIGSATRETALAGAATDLGARSLESFAVAVSQALALGAPLTETLAGQSREIRAAHRAEVERDIERAPIKLLIPTSALILPALLLSILGPLLAASGMM